VILCANVAANVDCHTISTANSDTKHSMITLMYCEWRCRNKLCLYTY